MKCEQVEQSILLQDSGELNAVGRFRLARHLAACPACRSYQVDLHATRNALHALPTPALAPGDRAIILEAASPDRREVVAWAPGRQPVAWWRPALATAVLAALLGAGLYLRPGTSPAPVEVARKAPAPVVTTLDEAVDEELDALQQLLVASLEDTPTRTEAETLDEETLARELLALQEL